MVDYCNTPDNIQCGNYDSDCYPDIARFNGNKLEIFLFMGKGYTAEPQQSRTFYKPIKSLKHDDNIWDGIDNLVVTFEDNSEKTFCHSCGVLDLNGTPGAPKKSEIPRLVSEADFQIVWESENYSWGVRQCVVGDLDNDGIDEFVTSWKEYIYGDTAWIAIYKCVGNNEYELFMEEPFFDAVAGTNPTVTFMLITDIDQNGQNELMFTYDACYFWEFSEPGIYTSWNSNFIFPRAVSDVKICDVDQDSITELAFVERNSDLIPPTVYQVWEFNYKSTVPENTIFMNCLWEISQNWTDARLDVGDFDNDGMIDIVSGNFFYVINYDPIETQYFRYDLSSGNFTQHWLYTGIPLRCVNPVIEDMDNDGENELYAGGLYPHGGSAFVYEGTGFQSGYVSWLDTTSAPEGPNQSCFGMVDCKPSVLSVYIIHIDVTGSKLGLWTYQDDSYCYVWESTARDSTFYNSPHIWDIDGDGKMNLLMADDIQHIIIDWEQTSAGIWEEPFKPTPQAFQLHTNYPNPFNSTTVIPFELSQQSDILLTIYDTAGRVVYEFTRDDLPPGHYTIDWEAGNQASGIYLIELIAGEERQIRKGILLK